MSKELSRTVRNEGDIPQAVSWVEGLLRRGVTAGAALIAVRRPSKSRIQEEKYHAMIGDIHRQCFRGYSAKGVKAVLVNQFALEMDEAGTPLAHPGERVWDWKTQEPVYVRPSTSEFRQHEASEFIEFLYATGTELGVQWSERAQSIYDEYREAA